MASDSDRKGPEAAACPGPERALVDPRCAVCGKCAAGERIAATLRAAAMAATIEPNMPLRAAA